MISVLTLFKVIDYLTGGGPFASILCGYFFRPLLLQTAPLLFLFQSAQLRPFADTCFLSYGNLLHCFPQQFNKTPDRDFLVFNLTARLLGYEAEDAVLAYSILKTAHDEFSIFGRKARGVHHIEPQRQARAYPVNVTDYLTGGSTCAPLNRRLCSHLCLLI